MHFDYNRYLDTNRRRKKIGLTQWKYHWLKSFKFGCHVSTSNQASAYIHYHCICFIWFTQQTRPSARGMPKVMGWTTQATRDTFYALSVLILLAAFSIIYTTQDNGYCPSALRNMTWMPRSTHHLTARLHYCSYSSLSATVSLRPLCCDYSSPDYCFLLLTLQACARTILKLN